MTGVHLAVPFRPSGGERTVSRKRIGVSLVVLVLAVPAGLLAIGTIRLPGSSPAAAPQVQAAARVAATDAAPGGAQPQPPAPRRASEARPASDRVVPPTHATALFAQHSWYVVPPAPPPAPPPPPPVATAPPFPYTFVGSFAPDGDQPVYFLARGDRVVDARVGDRLDGVYQFESAAGGQLVFVYLPLNVRQNVAAGGAK